MKKKYIIHLLLIILFNTIDCNNNQIELQRHEQWWENHLDKNKMEHFKRWLGDEDAVSRVKMRDYIKTKSYKNILDIPCGLCVDFYGLMKDNIHIDYYGIDITPKLVKRAQDLGVKVRQGSIENIPMADNAIELCYARHILEHLDGYEKAIDELIRVANKEVIIIFFMTPQDNTEFRDAGDMDGLIVHHNRYNKIKLDEYINQNSKVAYFMWQKINDQESALHIYCK